MSNKVLIVDDEANLLDSMRRSLSRRYDLLTALGPEEGLKLLNSKENIAVVISDLAMPGMDGIKFLAKVKEKSPLSVRMMLTGHGDLDAAMSAVNQGNIFRFMTKPCPVDELVRAIDAGLEQYRLITAEKELLRGTLRGCIKVLTDILNLVCPEAFSRGERVKRLMLSMAKHLGLSGALKYELAGMLSQIGMISVPNEIVNKRFKGLELSPEEEQIYRMHSFVASTLLSNIPRIQDVVEIVGCQKDCLGSESEMPEGAKLLNLCLEYDDLEQLGLPKNEIMEKLRPGWISCAPELLKTLEQVVFSDDGYVPRTIGFNELRDGMILRQDIIGGNGVLIMAKGQEITEVARLRLEKMSKSFNLAKQLEVSVPL